MHPDAGTPALQGLHCTFPRVPGMFRVALSNCTTERHDLKADGNAPDYQPQGRSAQCKLALNKLDVCVQIGAGRRTDASLSNSILQDRGSLMSGKS
jgi:hypothetical protein